MGRQAIVAACCAAAWLLGCGIARADVQLSIADGRVSLVAKDATVRQIMAEWERIGQTKVVNLERVPGGPITLELRDVVTALLKLVAEPRAVGQVINIGTMQEVTILQLAERVRELTGSRSPIKLVPYDQAYESGFEDMPRRVPDLTKVSALIGYEPQHSLDDILTQVIDYFRSKSRPF